jgi:tetratricopeptide (TPR) repeat protein
VPARLSADYGFAIINPEADFDGIAAIGALALIALVVALLGFFRRERTWRSAALLAAMFIASYALISNTALLIGVSLAERLMYWPSVPVALLAGLGIVELWRRQCRAGGRLAGIANALRLLGIALVVVLGLRSVTRTFDWSNNITLFHRDVQTFPQGAHLRKCFAAELIALAIRTDDAEQRVALLNEADIHLAAALQIQPTYADVLAMCGQVAAELDRREQAMRYLRSALRLKPGMQAAQQALAKLERGVGHDDQSLARLQNQVRETPDDPALRIALGETLINYGRAADAIEHLERAVALAPEDLDALRLLAQAEAVSRPGDRAIQLYQEVLRRDPDNWEAHANLSTLLADRDPAATLEHARRAYALQPNDVRSLGNLAEALALNGRNVEAIEIYEGIARSLDPEDPFLPVIRERLKHLRK